jgi:hypothetical protein
LIDYLDKANNIEVILALADCSMKYNFISLKPPKDITKATHKPKGKKTEINELVNNI